MVLPAGVLDGALELPGLLVVSLVVLLSALIAGLLVGVAQLARILRGLLLLRIHLYSCFPSSISGWPAVTPGDSAAREPAVIGPRRGR